MPIARCSRHGLAPDGAEDYTALAGHSGAMEEVAQGRQVDEAQVPQGTSSVSVNGSAGTSVSLAAPSLGLSVKGEGLSGSATSAAALGGGIVPQCTRHALDSYYATDHLGTVRFVKTVDDTGIVTTSTHDYEPFGVEITPTDSCDNTHKFTGHERDVETGNDYMHFRFYGASIGRFQKPDSNFDSPIANPQGWNLYSYVKGNPVNFNDPTGHDTGIPWRVQGAVSGGGTAAPGKQVLQADAFGGGLSIGGTPWDDAFSSMYGEMYKASGQAANQPAQQQAQQTTQTPAPSQQAAPAQGTSIGPMAPCDVMKDLPIGTEIPQEVKSHTVVEGTVQTTIEIPSEEACATPVPTKDEQGRGSAENPSGVTGKQVIEGANTVQFSIPGQPCSDHLYWAYRKEDRVSSADPHLEWKTPLDTGPRSQEMPRVPLDPNIHYIYLGNFPYQPR